ncbi:hypothetical protein JCM10296v2_007852 [Rhodotorula toruloides]
MTYMDTSFEHSALLRRLEQARDTIASRLPNRRRSKFSQSSANIFARYEAELDKAFRLRWHVYGRMYPRLKQGEASVLVDAISVWERNYTVDRIAHLVDPLFYSNVDRVLLANDGTIVGLLDALVELDRLAHELEELRGLEAHVAARRQSLENARQALRRPSADEHSLSHPLLNQRLSTRKARIYGMV